MTAPGEELDRALEIATTIAEQAPLAAAADFGPTQRRLMASADAAEGLRAFLERRKGAFEGR